MLGHIAVLQNRVGNNDFLYQKMW